MTIPDVNAVVRKYLAEHADVIAFFAPDLPRVFCPRLPENTKIPAIGLFVRGGVSTPYIPPIVSPSLQIDCWAKDELQLDGTIKHGSIIARELYLVVYSVLQGIQNISVEVPAGSGIYYKILSAREEVQGQDLVDIDVQGYFRVLTFFEIMVR